MVVNAQPPAPKRRGKRYVFELAAPPGELDRAIDRLSPGKRLVRG